MASMRPLRSSTFRSLHTVIPRRPSPSLPPRSGCARVQRRTLFYLPVVLQPAFWRSLVPSFLLKRDPDAVPVRRRPWNPATYFIWMFLLIGSQAIQLVTLRTGFDKFSRETEERLALLRDVMKRKQKGEPVDVARELGTGDEPAEKAWEQVMAELATENAIFQDRRKQEEERRRAREAAAAQSAKEDAQ